MKFSENWTINKEVHHLNNGPLKTEITENMDWLSKTTYISKFSIQNKYNIYFQMHPGIIVILLIYVLSW